ncbi:MAG: phosphate ABC transporter permease subunit PstC [Chthonomonadales bacterium]
MPDASESQVPDWSRRPRTGGVALLSSAALGDGALEYVTLAFGLLVIVLIFWIGYGLWHGSEVSRHMFGWRLLRSSEWDVPKQTYGALPFIYGTFVSSLVGLVLAAPVAIGCALFLTEIAPRFLAGPIAFLIELLAAVPSVIYGLWGFLVLCPWMQDHVYPWLEAHFGTMALFAGPATMTNMLAAGLILAIMMLPFITSVSREVILTVPSAQREASLGLGATRWETIRHVVMAHARLGIVGAVMLALGRAIGETMAVVMVIGNNPQISASLLQPGYTMPALLANQFNEAYTDDVQRSALIEIALILFVITVLVTAAARAIILLMERRQARAGLVKVAGRIGAQVMRWTAGTALGALLLIQVASDVRRHGAAGLLGLIEAAVLLVAIGVIGGRLAQSTPLWNPLRKLTNALAHAALTLCAFTACLVLGLLLGYVITQGGHALRLTLFTQLPAPPGEPGGGMKNGIVGTGVLVGIAAVISIPVGLLGGVFLAEFRTRRIGAAIRFCADVLNGIPSVVIGMFAYTAFVLPVKHFSAAAGGAALGIMMIPTILRTTEQMMLLVPGALREASLGLGATRLRTTLSVVLPAARAGIVTGAMLAVARVAGETAPLLFTAFGNDEASVKLTEPISSMTMMIYRYATSAYPDWIAQAWAGALVLVGLVLVVSILARVATRNRYALR